MTIRPSDPPLLIRQFALTRLRLAGKVCVEI